LTASNFVRGETRRHRREQEAHMQAVLDESGSDVWRQIAPLLDSAVGSLSEKDRQAIVLRFYEGRNLRDVGAALGASEDAAEKRVSRAVERLREFLAKRGVTAGASGLVVAISANAVQAAPVGLVVKISTAATVAGTTIVAAEMCAVQPDVFHGGRSGLTRHTQILHPPRYALQRIKEQEFSSVIFASCGHYLMRRDE